MNGKQAAAFLAAALAATPAQAWDYREQDQPYTSLFVRIPLDGRSPKEQLPVWGFAVRGKRDYQVLRLDSESLTRFVDMGFIESKILLVGVIAAGGALAVASSGSKSAATQQQQQQQAVQQQAAQQQAQAASAPASGTSHDPCVCPAPK